MTDTEESIELSWTPRVAELADAHIARTRELGAINDRGALGALVALCAAPMLFSRTTFPLAVGLYTLAFYFVWRTRVTAAMTRRRWASLVAVNPPIVEPLTAEVSASGVRMDGDLMSVSRRWSAFTSWSETSDAVVLATSEQSGGAIVVLPHRAAAGPEDLAAIRALTGQQLGHASRSGHVGAGRRRQEPWAARITVLVLLIVPLALVISTGHSQTGRWRFGSSAESPPVVSYEGSDFTRVGSATARPRSVVGVAYTPGGGLIMEQYPRPARLSEIWVLDHDNVVRHYVSAGTDRSPPPGGKAVSREQAESSGRYVWPFTVDAGTLSCLPVVSTSGVQRAVVFTTEDGVQYGINGIATGAGGFAHPTPIVAIDPATGPVDEQFTFFIEEGLELCPST